MNRRTHRQLALITLLISLFASLGCDAMVSRLVDRAAERQMNSTDLALLEDDALNVFLCGTGSPLPDPTSAGACTIVVAGGKVYVVDVGPGSQEVAQVAGIPTSALAGILLTHFHSDHISELGEWALQSWVGGRTGPLHVYGPEGIHQIVAGFRQAYRLDAEYRIAHHGLENMPRSATEWIAHAVPHANGAGAKILDEAGLVVTGFAVDHRPVEPAVGYRFAYRGRSVVISGDTAKSSNLEANAKGADLLVHDVLLEKLMGRVSDALGEAGQKRLQRLSKDILEYHASPGEAAQSANTAGVDTLVFTHLVPPVPGPLREWLSMRDVDAGDVDVILGEDGMRFRLPANSDVIEID